MADVFGELAKKLNALPEDIKKAYMEASKKAINEEGMNLEKNLRRGSQQAQFIPELKGRQRIDKEKWEQAKRNLQENIYTKQYESPSFYTYEVDWKDKIVDEDLDINWGKYKKVERRRGARNYSNAPATYHDLAYILSEGRAVNFSKQNIKVVQGTGFIKKAWRNAKKWKDKRDRYFKVEMELLGRKFDEDNPK